LGKDIGKTLVTALCLDTEPQRTEQKNSAKKPSACLKEFLQEEKDKEEKTKSKKESNLEKETSSKESKSEKGTISEKESKGKIPCSCGRNGKTKNSGCSWQMCRSCCQEQNNYKKCAYYGHRQRSHF